MTNPSVSVAGLVELVREGRLDEFVAGAHELESADLADVLASLDHDERLVAVRALPPEISSHALIEMPEEARAEEMLAALDVEEAAGIVDELDDDDAADLLGELEPEEQERILAEVEHRAEVDRLLGYGEETAGGRMTTQLVSVRAASTAREALDAIRRQAEEVGDFYQIFVVDAGQRLVGVLPLKDLVVSPSDRPVSAIMTDADIRVGPELDQEEVARLMARYNLPSVPVVDPAGRLLGRVTFDDVTDVVEAETTEDLLQFGGVSADEELAGTWGGAVRSRLPWLGLNSLTALGAGLVIMTLSAVIDEHLVLAALMPVVAGLGGNAGTQALAVTVRRLSLGLVSRDRFWRVVGKETLVGLTNGAVLGLTVGLIATLVGASPMLGVAVGLAMVGNLFVAGFAGAFIPLMLDRLGVDPAIASSVFITALTDICGFALLLGLAGMLLL